MGQRQKGFYLVMPTPIVPLRVPLNSAAYDFTQLGLSSIVPGALLVLANTRNHSP